MISSNDLIVGGPLFVSATKAGYEVLSNRSQSVVEITGDGNWEQFEKACHKFVMNWHNGHQYDHVSIIVRHVDGTRELRDVGVNSVRYGILPNAGFKWKRTYTGCGLRSVRQEGHHFRCQMTVQGKRLYLGMWPTAEEAGRARDRYIIEWGLDVPLNFPEAKYGGSKVGRQFADLTFQKAVSHHD